MKKPKPRKKQSLRVKPSNPTKKKKKAVKPRFEDYINMRTLETTPVSKEWIERLALRLVQWAIENEDALLMKQFYLANGLSCDAIRRFGERSEKWKKAIETAKMAIGARRELGAIKKEFSEGMVKNSLPFYGTSWSVGEDYKKLEEWRAELRKTIEEARGSGEVHVHMDSYLSKPKAKK